MRVGFAGGMLGSLGLLVGLLPVGLVVVVAGGGAVVGSLLWEKKNVLRWSCIYFVCLI